MTGMEGLDQILYNLAMSNWKVALAVSIGLKILALYNKEIPDNRVGTFLMHMLAKVKPKKEPPEILEDDFIKSLSDNNLREVSNRLRAEKRKRKTT